MAAKALTTEQKKVIIENVMITLKNQAILLNRRFDEGIFFSLAFMTDRELLKTKRLCGVNN